METEVLAPAGSIEGLKAALYAGADAVYTGGRMFGARAYANNLSDEELSECIDYCHLHNKKIISDNQYANETVGDLSTGRLAGAVL